ncbi:hypothetical protein GBAR_LOCUS1508 [Geodia barretti]|uniref:Uncharacterized protein n=1 Tax=Geodia barretti TaxID=519541 RepID=A0AA35QXN4_GEOBA|nr:hypothetical protein GBAR_LOCUS1508 [Geodia barretti]
MWKAQARGGSEWDVYNDVSTFLVNSSSDVVQGKRRRGIPSRRGRHGSGVCRTTSQLLPVSPRGHTLCPIPRFHSIPVPSPCSVSGLQSRPGLSRPATRLVQTLFVAADLFSRRRVFRVLSPGIRPLTPPVFAQEQVSRLNWNSRT